MNSNFDKSKNETPSCRIQVEGEHALSQQSINDVGMGSGQIPETFATLDPTGDYMECIQSIGDESTSNQEDKLSGRKRVDKQANSISTLDEGKVGSEQMKLLSSHASQMNVNKDRHFKRQTSTNQKSSVDIIGKKWKGRVNTGKFRDSQDSSVQSHADMTSQEETLSSPIEITPAHEDDQTVVSGRILRNSPKNRRVETIPLRERPGAFAVQGILGRATGIGSTDVEMANAGGEPSQEVAEDHLEEQERARQLEEQRQIIESQERMILGLQSQAQHMHEDHFSEPFAVQATLVPAEEHDDHQKPSTPTIHAEIVDLRRQAVWRISLLVAVALFVSALSVGIAVPLSRRGSNTSNSKNELGVGVFEYPNSTSVSSIMTLLPTAHPTLRPTSYPTVLPTGRPTAHPSELIQEWLQVGLNAYYGSEDEAGTSIAISRDGLSIAVGAPGKYYHAVYIFKFKNDQWNFIAEIGDEAEYSGNGRSVAVDNSGSIVVIGAPFAMPEDSENVTATPGRVRVFRVNLTAPETDGNYVQIGSDIVGSKNDSEFGWSVDMSENGTIIAIGSRNNCKAEVRKYNESTDEWADLGKVFNCTAGYDDSFGTAISLSKDGSVLAVGEPGNAESSLYGFPEGDDTNGRVRVFRYNPANDGLWEQLGQTLDGEAINDAFGTSLALSDDGLILAIGAPFNDANRGPIINVDSALQDPAIGSCRVFEYNITSGLWQQRGSDINGEAIFDYFGTSVSLNSDGNVLAVGAFGSNDNGDDSGHVRIFQYNVDKSDWVQVGKDIVGPFAGAMSGMSVALSAQGDIVTIGAPSNVAVNSDRKGVARVFETGVVERNGNFPVTVVIGTGECPELVQWSIERLDVESQETVIVAEFPMGSFFVQNQTEKQALFVPVGGVYRLMLQNAYCTESEGYGFEWYEIYLSASTDDYDQRIVQEVNLTGPSQQHTFVAVPVANSSESEAATKFVTLVIDFDDYPQEIHWVLLATEMSDDGRSITQQRTILAYGPVQDYEIQLAGRSYHRTIGISAAIRASEFKFIFIDDGRDGLCCNYGSGSYKLYNGSHFDNENDLLFQSTAEMKRREVHSFVV